MAICRGVLDAKIERRFQRDEADRYVEPPWVGARVRGQHFPRTVINPACGCSRILESAQAAECDRMRKTMSNLPGDFDYLSTIMER
jgi:hypothetical protein